MNPDPYAVLKLRPTESLENIQKVYARIEDLFQRRGGDPTAWARYQQAYQQIMIERTGSAGGQGPTPAFAGQSKKDPSIRDEAAYRRTQAAITAEAERMVPMFQNGFDLRTFNAAFEQLKQQEDPLGGVATAGAEPAPLNSADPYGCASALTDETLVNGAPAVEGNFMTQFAGPANPQSYDRDWLQQVARTQRAEDQKMSRGEAQKRISQYHSQSTALEAVAKRRGGVKETRKAYEELPGGEVDEIPVVPQVVVNRRPTGNRGRQQQLPPLPPLPQLSSPQLPVTMPATYAAPLPPVEQPYVFQPMPPQLVTPPLDYFQASYYPTTSGYDYAQLAQMAQLAQAQAQAQLAQAQASRRAPTYMAPPVVKQTKRKLPPPDRARLQAEVARMKQKLAEIERFMQS
jgi:hypothetical protein